MRLIYLTNFDIILLDGTLMRADLTHENDPEQAQKLLALRDRFRLDLLDRLDSTPGYFLFSEEEMSLLRFVMTTTDAAEDYEAWGRETFVAHNISIPSQYYVIRHALICEKLL